jgi:hypothetical protein
VCSWEAASWQQAQPGLEQYVCVLPQVGSPRTLGHSSAPSYRVPHPLYFHGPSPYFPGGHAVEVKGGSGVGNGLVYDGLGWDGTVWGDAVWGRGRKGCPRIFIFKQAILLRREGVGGRSVCLR